MQRNEITFTEEESAVLRNHTFLPLKHQATDKVISLMSAVREAIDEVWQEQGHQWAIPCTQDDVKISRGENYRQLPYVILDYPRKFSRDDVFAFRSMFWWGQLFSYTLHLQGRSLQAYRQRLIEQLPHRKHQLPDVYLCVGETPWQYHYGADNYRLLSDCSDADILEILEGWYFVKLSTWIPVNASAGQVQTSGQYWFRQFMELLYGEDKA